MYLLSQIDKENLKLIFQKIKELMKNQALKIF